MPTKSTKRNSVKILNYLTIYFPDEEASMRVKLEKVAKRRKVSVNALLLDIIRNYLNIIGEN